MESNKTAHKKLTFWRSTACKRLNYDLSFHQYAAQMHKEYSPELRRRPKYKKYVQHRATS